MIKKTVSYIGYDGESHTEDHYFNMSKAELMKLQVRQEGDYLKTIRDLIMQRKIEGPFNFLYDFVLDAHGERSEDGTRFYKTPQNRADFEASPAFSEIISSLFTGDVDEKAVAVFIRGTLPPDWQPDEAGPDVPRELKAPPKDVITVEATPASD